MLYLNEEKQSLKGCDEASLRPSIEGLQEGLRVDKAGVEGVREGQRAKRNNSKHTHCQW